MKMPQNSPTLRDVRNFSLFVEHLFDNVGAHRLSQRYGVGKTRVEAIISTEFVRIRPKKTFVRFGPDGPVSIYPTSAPQNQLHRNVHVLEAIRDFDCPTRMEGPE